MTHKPRNYWTEEHCAEEAKKYKKRGDFYKYSVSAYVTARKNGWLDKICSHMELTPKQKKALWCQFDQCKIEAKKYVNRKEFRSKSEIAYNIAKSNNWLDLFFENSKSVLNGWWQDKGHCLEAALQYEQRTEFAHGIHGAFLAAYRNGWLDDICKHMDDYQREKGTYKHKGGYWTKEKCIEVAKKCADNGESKQQFIAKYSAAHRAILKNDWASEVYSVFPVLGNLYKRCIYAYEFSDNFAYIGLTCNIFRRNRDHYSQKESPVYKHMLESNLHPKLKIVYDYMPKEEAKKQEGKILKKYLNEGWNILNRAKAGALGHGYPIWSKEECKKIASQYITLKDFSTNEPKCYGAIMRQGWIDEICSHMKRRKISLMEMKNVAKKYDTILDFRRGDNKIYSAAQRHRLLDEITHGMKLGHNGPSENKIRTEAANYEYYSDFINKSKLYYKWAIRLGILEEVTSHMKRTKHKITFEKCKEIASKCNNRTEFKKMYPSGYLRARKSGWLDEICAHMKPMYRIYTNELLFDIANKYKTKKEFQEKDNSAYSYAYNHNLLDGICAHMINQKRKPYTLDECMEAAKKYNTRVEFQRKNNKIYLATQRNGWLDIVCSHMEVKLRKITKDMCYNVAKNCKTRSEFQKQDGSCYNAARKRGWLDEICKHMKSTHRKIQE